MPSLLAPPRDFCGKLQIYHFTTDISSPYFKSFKIFFNSSVFNFVSVHLLKVCLNNDPHELHTPQFSFKILSSIRHPSISLPITLFLMKTRVFDPIKFLSLEFIDYIAQVQFPRSLCLRRCLHQI